ncbi:MAG: fused MFS/spermidine synthase [Planctomycetota bacterium]
MATTWPVPARARTRERTQVAARSGDLALAWLSGLLVVALEVGAARLIAVAVSQSIYGFAIMLFACIGGLAIGAYAAGRWLCRTADEASASVALLIGGAGVAMLSALLGQLPQWLVPASTVTFGRWLVLHVLCAGLVLLPASAGLGMLFPLLLGRAARAADGARAIGQLSAANAIGAVAGSFGASFALMPLLGPRCLLVAVAAVALVCGFSIALRRRAAPRWLLVPGMVAAAFLGLPAEWSDDLYLRSPGVYREPAGGDGSRRTVEFVAHDAHATIAVGRRERPGSAPYRFFSVNGKIDGGESELDMATQQQLATWPLTLYQGQHPAERALVIGLGTGATVGEALRFPLHGIDVVEISRPVVRVARDFFARINHGALADPRVAIHLTDGRHFLASQTTRYDVVISEPSNPWIAGIGALYTTEAFTQMRGCLRDGGVACQWVQAYELDEALFRTIVATFAGVFPECYVVMPHDEGFDVLLLGIHRPAAERLPPSRLTAALALRTAVPPELDFTPQSAEQLAARFLMGPDAIARYAAGATLQHRRQRAARARCAARDARARR